MVAEEIFQSLGHGGCALAGSENHDAAIGGKIKDHVGLASPHQGKPFAVPDKMAQDCAVRGHCRKGSPVDVEKSLSQYVHLPLLANAKKEGPQGPLKKS